MTWCFSYSCNHPPPALAQLRTKAPETLQLARYMHDPNPPLLRATLTVVFLFQLHGTLPEAALRSRCTPAFFTHLMAVVFLVVQCIKLTYLFLPKRELKYTVCTQCMHGWRASREPSILSYFHMPLAAVQEFEPRGLHTFTILYQCRVPSPAPAFKLGHIIRSHLCFSWYGSFIQAFILFLFLSFFNVYYYYYLRKEVKFI